jgi:hypothetical protein
MLARFVDGEEELKNRSWPGAMRGLGVVLMSLTAFLTLMGAAGTTCVALDPTGYDGRFAAIEPFQWLYVLLVIVTLAAGMMGVRAVVLLIRAKKHAYRDALVALGAGVVVGIAHMAASRLLRGSSMPVDMVVYTTIVTLIVFLLFRIPGLWQGIGFEGAEGPRGIDGRLAAIALAACGVVTLGLPFLMAPTHTIAGVNYANVGHRAMTAIGLMLILAGCGQYATKAARRGAPSLLAPRTNET